MKKSHKIPLNCHKEKENGPNNLLHKFYPYLSTVFTDTDDKNVCQFLEIDGNFSENVNDSVTILKKDPGFTGPINFYK